MAYFLWNNSCVKFDDLLVFFSRQLLFNDSCYIWSLLTPFIYTFYPIFIICNMLGINFGIGGTILLYVLLFYLLSTHKVFNDTPQSTMYKTLKAISEITRKYMVWLLLFDIVIYIFCRINKLVLKTCEELSCIC